MSMMPTQHSLASIVILMIPSASCPRAYGRRTKALGLVILHWALHRAEDEYDDASRGHKHGATIVSRLG